ncbi:hypothetical protein F4808DRAFT_471828 [Astrocystis sublimbata]|nr:hypothetical protein F4808DRAFT_471828 [Astrocystis sublimbata]
MEAPLYTLNPLNTLNEFRAELNLPPSRNLISSAVFMTKSELAHLSAYPRDSLVRCNTPSHTNKSPPASRELEKQNCHLWITNLPPQCTVHALLEGIRNTGPVSACEVITPMSAWGKAAASLTFFTAEGANRFLAQIALRPFTVQDHIASVSRHRIHVDSTIVNGKSRVLRIVGHPSIVNPMYLTWYFSECCPLKIDTDFMEFLEGEGGNEVTWAFGSFRGQAQVVYSRVNHDWFGLAKAMYLADPCVVTDRGSGERTVTRSVAKSHEGGGTPHVVVKAVN